MSSWLASGVAEAVGGAGLLVPRTQRAAGWWLLATLAAVFPANVHMALHHGPLREDPALGAARAPALPARLRRLGRRGDARGLIPRAR